jgi:hypothetical protein
MSALVLLAALTLGPVEAPSRAQPPAAQAAQAARPVARLRALDKFSGLTTDFDAPAGGAVRFSRLVITVRACREMDDGADAAAYLEIVDDKNPAAFAFAGWMIASVPAVSALDHPRYDVWVLACSTASAQPS